ncbi:hypothetical protein C8F01DRAFT_660775 [Mycena amicta]|nr:hypothetical protein C8F01DRAFT_660775 [Mycena amicta]
MEVDQPQSGAGADSSGVRAPKRPWEVMEMDGEEVDELEDSEEAPYPTPPPPATSTVTAAPATTAEQDMELIRTKRAATSAGGVNGALTKTKYRKRSQRATPPGKCHSCHIRETPEWRRGPDGARTLCNACGLHYAKLLRKREKESASNGGATVAKIDMETLRASARADQGEKTASASASAAARKAAVAAAAAGAGSSANPASKAAPSQSQSGPRPRDDQHRIRMRTDVEMEDSSEKTASPGPGPAFATSQQSQSQLYPRRPQHRYHRHHNPKRIMRVHSSCSYRPTCRRWR